MRNDLSSLQGVSAHTGFPNPSIESPLDSPNFNRLLIKHPSSTFCMRVAGSHWEDRGIYNGDIVVVDRALHARAQDLVIWWQNNSFILTRLRNKPKKESIWGVVTTIIHQFRRTP